MLPLSKIICNRDSIGFVTDTSGVTLKSLTMVAQFNTPLYVSVNTTFDNPSKLWVIDRAVVLLLISSKCKYLR